jgi:hypothetical protein
VLFLPQGLMRMLRARVLRRTEPQAGERESGRAGERAVA